MEAGTRTAGPVWVGIDLGTTNSVVACVDRAGLPATIVNFEGEALTPSKLFIDGEAVLAGRGAIKAGEQQGEKYAEAFKRYMGEDRYPQPVDGRNWRPEVLSALLLRRLKQDAERRLGRIDGAVITVPAYFDESRRRATCAAAEIAGWTVVDLINEPTAAALAYADRAGRAAAGGEADEHLLVFDLGGGTMDATVLRIAHGQEYRTVATDGEVQLGGMDWDARLRDHLAAQFRSRTGVDPLASRDGTLAFLRLAESAKIALSRRMQARVPCVFASQRLLLEVDRATFESLTSDLLDRTRITAELVMEQAKLRWQDVGTILTVGGSTRMPMIERLLTELAGRRPQQDVSVDEAVAHGAALYARLRASHSSVRVINVNSHSYRVLARRPDRSLVAHPLIAKNSPLPALGQHRFGTRPGQDHCSIVICDGESDEPQDCAQIGKVIVEDLPPAADHRWLVNVRLTCRQDGKLEVGATVHHPQHPGDAVRQARVTIVPRQGISQEDVDQARRQVAEMEIS